MGKKTHGLSDHPLRMTWNQMRARCHATTNRAYPKYGGRGIYVCDRWREPEGRGFLNFLVDMGPRSDGMTLERVNNDGPYSPDNCRWATRREQANNTRQVRFLEFRGERKTMPDWARSIGIKPSTLKARLNDHGWSVERALTEEVHFG